MLSKNAHLNISFKPKVSIIIPVYNGANYLRDAIESALAQTYSYIEVVVVNDGSHDDGQTEAIALEFAERIRYFYKENGGVSTALNLGIREMKGEYFSWLSHDDLYAAEKIEVQIRELAKIENRDSVVMYSNYATQFVDKSRLEEVHLQNTAPESFRYQVAVDNKLHGCTLLIPKAAFVECGLFREDLRATQDYDMWFRLGKKYSFIHMQNSLVIGRVHGEQVGVKMRGRVIQENIAFRKKCLDELTREEVILATHKSISFSFASLVEIFLRRELYPVAAHAFILSAKTLRCGGLLNALIWPFYLIKSLLMGMLFVCYSSLRQFVHFRRG